MVHFFLSLLSGIQPIPDDDDWLFRVPTVSCHRLTRDSSSWRTCLSKKGRCSYTCTVPPLFRSTHPNLRCSHIILVMVHVWSKLVKDTTPHNHTFGKFTGHRTWATLAVHRAVTGVFLFSKNYGGSYFFFFKKNEKIPRFSWETCEIWW